MISTSEDKAAAPKNKLKERKFKPPKKITERYLHNAGLAYLKRFPASTAHFRSIMIRKINKSCRHHTDQKPEDCTALLDKLILKFQELGLLNDEAYLKGMITSLRRRGLSKRQIEAKLNQKGMSGDMVQQALQKHDAEEYETDNSGDIYAALIFARRKKIGPFDTNQKHLPEKALATMARAGYSYDIAKKTLEISQEELEEKLTRLSSL